MIMKRTVGIIAKRNADGTFTRTSDIIRDIPEREIGASGLTKTEEACLKTAAETVFAPLYYGTIHQREGGEPNEEIL